MGPKLPACTMSALRGHASATSWIAMTASIKVPPTPPSFSPNAMPMRRCPAIFRAVSQGYFAPCARSSAPAASSSRAKRRTDSANARCSGESWKSIERVQLPELCEEPARLCLADHRSRELEEFRVDVGVAERRLGIALAVRREMLEALPGARDQQARGSVAREGGGQRRILVQRHLAQQRADGGIVQPVVVE